MQAEVLEQAVFQAVNPAVDLQRLAPCPGVLHNRRVANVARLLDDVELAEQIELLGVRARLDGPLVLLLDVDDVAQPVVNQSEAAAVEGRLDAAAAVMAADDDVLDAQGLCRGRRCGVGWGGVGWGEKEREGGEGTREQTDAPTAYCSTLRQLRSVCTTTLATLRCTKSSPGRRSTTSLAGTRLSEQPIHKYLGDCCLDKLSKKSGWSLCTRSDQERFCANRLGMEP